MANETVLRNRKVSEDRKSVQEMFDAALDAQEFLGLRDAGGFLTVLTGRDTGPATTGLQRAAAWVV